MKRLIPVLAAVILVLSMSVSSFAAFRKSGWEKVGDDIRFDPIITSTIPEDVKQFLRDFFSATEDTFFYADDRRSSYGDAYLYFAINTGSYSFTCAEIYDKSQDDYRFDLSAPQNLVDYVRFKYDFSSKTYKFSEKYYSTGTLYLTEVFYDTLEFSFPARAYPAFSGDLIFNMDEDLSAPPVTKHDLTINYQYSNGTEAVGTYCGSFDEGTTYDIPSPVISGFVPDKISVIGTMPNADVTETVTYNKKKATLTIKYLYEDGSEAAPTYVGEYDVGEMANVTSPVIAGYKPSLAVVSGAILDWSSVINVTYTKIDTPVSSSEPSSSEESSSGGSSSDTAEKYDLTIDYQKPDGTDLAGAYKAKLAEGETYNVPSPTIGGYVPDRYSVFGTMPNRAVTEKVTYLQGSGGGVSGNPYVPWDINLVFSAIGNLRSSIGSAFNIGIWIFIIMTGIYLVAKIVDSIGQ